MVELEKTKISGSKSRIERLPLPAELYLPLSQHIGKPSLPEVSPGDKVHSGQKLASASAHISGFLHSPVAGVVSAIQDHFHPLLGRGKVIIIKTDNPGAPSPAVYSRRPDREAEGLAPEQIRQIVFESGIVGMGGAGFPTQIKLNPPKPVDTLIVNAAECEPYLTSDYRLMLEGAEGIIKGAALAAKCLGAKQVLIALEEGRPEAAAALTQVLRSTIHDPRSTKYALRLVKSGYPQGSEKQLIKKLLNREVPSGRLPFDVGAGVQNVATLYAVYEAVYFGKPLYERLVTVAGSCISQPKNLLVPIGTLFGQLIRYCGLKKGPAKIIMGGPMMGTAQYTDQVPVIKTTTGILLLDEEESAVRQQEPCIRCGACVRECPVGLEPCLINLASEKALWALAKKYHALDCLECGLCDYACPAKRRLLETIRRSKWEALK